MMKSRKPNTIQNESLNMTSDVKTISPRMRVIRSIRQWIDDGDLLHGDRLPAEMTLAQQLDVSRDTVRAALKHLEEQGLLSNSRNRTRRVVAQAQQQKQTHSLSLMAKSIAVLASFGNVKEPQPSSFMVVVQHEAVEQITRSGWHALRLEPQHVAEPGFCKQLLSDPPAGLLITEGVINHQPARDLIQQCAQAGVPIVINDDEPEIPGCDHVIFDHFAGSRMVTEYLIQQGARNITPLFCCDPNRLWAQRRLAGYQAAMQDAGLEPMAVNWVPAMYDNATDHTAKQHLELQSRLFIGYLAPQLAGPRVPDAVITINDGHTFPVAIACRILGLEPNVDIKIAGYDNTWTESYERPLESTVPIVTVDKNNPQAGQEMVRLLVERLEHRLADEPQIRKIQPRLVIPNA
jgi:DNA-binding LacI/PurR family transcriptional regulator